MRLALFALVALVPLAAGCAGQGRAPYCSRSIPGEGDAIRCNFPTMEACRFEVLGRGGACIRNPAMQAEDERTPR